MNCSNCRNTEPWYVWLFHMNARKFCRACAGIYRQGLTEYRVNMKQAMSDGKLENHEVLALEEVGRKGLLTPADLQRFRLEAFGDAYRNAIADRKLTLDEEQMLKELQAALKIPDTEIQNQLSSLARLRLMREAQLGNLPTLSAAPVLPKKGEQFHYQSDASLLEERVVSRRYEGGSQGVSFRIAKGVTYRVGSHRGHLISETDIVQVDRGSFVISNQRVGFVGARVSFMTPFAKILNFTVYKDGLSLNREGKTKPQVIKLKDTELAACMLAGAANNFANNN